MGLECVGFNNLGDRDDGDRSAKWKTIASVEGSAACEKRSRDY